MSRPSCSCSAVTRASPLSLSAYQTAAVAVSVQPPMMTTPTSWATKCAPTPALRVPGAATNGNSSVPRTPALPWTGNTAQTSSILSVSETNSKTIGSCAPARPPTISAPHHAVVSGMAVMPTSPASRPLATYSVSTFPVFSHTTSAAPIPPAAIAMVVPIATRLTVSVLNTPPLTTEAVPTLKPYQPNARMSVPSTANVSE